VSVKILYCYIKIVDEKLDKIQEAMEEELSQTSLAQVVADAEARI